INHTILGDDMYAKNSEKDIIQKYILRQALHAYKVSFIHPITAKLIVVNAKIPNDMLALM
ncbi:MAG: RluA family pseudouridine synthase, partial [Clostridia bacterium]